MPLHLILTRFNLQYDADNTIGISSEWLNNRFTLFEQYCLPSVQKQTVQNFRWILICDIHTPDEYKVRLEHYKDTVPQIEVVYSGWMEDFNQLYRQIGNQYAENGTTLITTRLDNDDALAPTYVEKVQEVAKSRKDCIITFPCGCQTFIQDNRSYRIEYVSNHFTSRIEHSGYLTALGFDHTQLATFGELVQVIPTDEPMWEEFVHSRNIANGYQPAYKYTITSVAEAADIMCRWFGFQTRRIVRLIKRLFVVTNK